MINDQIRSMLFFTNIFIITQLGAKLSRKLKNFRVETFAKRQYSHRSFILKKYIIQEFPNNKFLRMAKHEQFAT